MFRLVSYILPEKAIQSLTAAYFKANTWWTIGSGKYHSECQHISNQNMDISILPALTDNYMYLLVDKSTKAAAIVDPVDADSVLKAVESAGVDLKAIITTHHHWDHAGGNENFVKLFKKPLTVYGGDDRIGALTNKVSHNDEFMIGNLHVKCLHTPCHTRGHICYYVTLPGDSSQKSIVFTGDTLFLSGCGKFFEGNASEMHNALINILGSLPDDTEVYCGHEYALSNLKFAMFMEPNNTHIKQKFEAINSRRENNQPSVPSSIGEEKKINPFMRTLEVSIQEKTGKTDPIEVMKEVRQTKDGWKPPKL